VVAIGVACFAVASLLIIQIFLLRPYIGIPLRQLWDDVRPGVVSGVLVIAVVWPVRMLLSGELTTVVLLGLLVAVGFGVYVLALRSLFADTWTDLVSILSRVSRRSRRPVVQDPTA
jgi:hypothetical protein